jgi:hypothetical protein
VDRIVPGWLDKGMPWRRARGEWLDNVILVAPSREYLSKLPHGKLPDRKEDNWVWSPQGLINMHVPDRWGYVRFSGARP